MSSGRIDHRSSAPLLLRAAALLCLLAAGTWVAAQYRVNTRVNTGLYGAGTYTTGSVRAAPYQTSALPSQTRHAYWSSGMSRAEVRANYSAMGPMASGGAISYVTPSRSREAVRGPLDVTPPSPARARPSAPPVGSAVLSTSGRGGGTPALGSVTYSRGGSSRAASPNSALGAGGMSTGGMSTGGLTTGGSILSGGSTEAVAAGASRSPSSPAASSSANNPGNHSRSGDSYSQFNSPAGTSSAIGSSFDDLYSSPNVARSGSIRFSDLSR